MEKLSIASIVASYIATLFVHFITILSILSFARDYVCVWFLSGKIQIAIGMFVIGFELRQDFLDPQKQQVLGLEFDTDASPSINSLIEMVLRFV